MKNVDKYNTTTCLSYKDLQLIYRFFKKCLPLSVRSASKASNVPK